MRAESLRYFLATAEAESLSIAACNIHITQQGLSKAIHAFENELQVKLFEKRGRKLYLSETGKALLPLAKQYVEIDELLWDTAIQHRGNYRAEGERITLLAMPFVCNSMFNLMHEELRFCGLHNATLVEQDLPEILQAMLRKGAAESDIALVSLPEATLTGILRDYGLAYEPLLVSQMGVVGSRKFFQPRKQTVTVSEVSSLPVTCYNEPLLLEMVERLFSTQPLTNIVLRTSNLSLQNEYVVSGQAITFFDSLSAYLAGHQEGAVFLPFKEPARFTTGFLHSASYTPSSAKNSYMQQFKACVLNRCRTYLAKYPVRK